MATQRTTGPKPRAASRGATVLEQRASQPLATTNGAPARGDRIGVRKTYKLYIGGAFPRSESGRTFEADGHNVARASRKDARDAVRAARAALPGWSGMTAYNRGQVLYRLAEMMERPRSWTNISWGR